MNMVESVTINGYELGGTQKDVGLSLAESIECSFCHAGIETQPLCFLDKGNDNIEIFLKCRKCKSSFVGYANLDKSVGCYRIRNFSKGNHKTTEFNQEINDVSQNFVKIYGEAEFAEQENLTEICGVGYRKALEFLIKDYLIKKIPEAEDEAPQASEEDGERSPEPGEETPNQEDEIKETPLGTCIREKIDNPRIKEIARRATWLGNDETHYFRKWENQDLKDLKKLIGITVHFISMELEADKYMEEMQD